MVVDRVCGTPLTRYPRTTNKQGNRGHSYGQDDCNVVVDMSAVYPPPLDVSGTMTWWNHAKSFRTRVLVTPYGCG